MALKYGWYNTLLTFRTVCADATSGISVFDHGANVTYTIEGTFPPRQFFCTDLAGNSVSYTLPAINLDGTAPSLSATVSPNPVALNGTATATPTASDALSGLASPATCAAVNTSLAGQFTVKCTATDKADNTATIDVPYSVTYRFSGFQAPIATGKLMSTNSGRAIPVTFSLGGYQGMSILAAGSPSSQPLACPTSSSGAPVTAAPTTANTNGGLSYDVRSDTYTIVWKTDKSWTGTCRTLNVKLSDGTEHTADFQFTK